MPAAMTSAAPTPLRERTSRALAALLLGCRRLLGRCDRRRVAATGATAARRPRPAARPATRSTSENQIPSARIVSRKASVTRPIPTATSIAPRPRGRRRAQAAVPAVGRVVGRHEHPGEPVEQDPHAAGRGRRHEDDAHDERVDAAGGARCRRRRRRRAGARGLRRSGSRRGAAVGVAPMSPSIMPAAAGRQSRRVSPAASRMSPTRKHASGANAAKLRWIASSASAISTAPKTTSPKPGDEGRQVGAAVVHAHALLPGAPSQCSCSL